MSLTSAKPLRTAIVGTGNIARQHAESLQRLTEETGGVELVAAADTDPDRLAGFTSEFSIAGYADTHALLAAEHVDLVHICTPPGAHTSVALAVLEAGGHVVLEKPATLTLAEFDRLAEAEGATGRYVATVSQHRFGSGVQRLRGLLESGAAGRPLLALCDTTWYRDQAYFDVEWRGRWDTEGGGPTMGHGIHQMDTVLSVLGPWTSVSAVARRQARVTDTEDVSLAHVAFENGAVASVVNSVVSPREESYLRFDFEYATVEVRHLYGYTDTDWTVTAAPGYEEQVKAAWTAGPADVRSEHLAQFRAIAAALHEGEAPPVTTTDARRTLQLVAGVYASAFGRTPIAPADLGPGSPHYALMQGDGPVW
ncbi:Gfo/Idh/MocA family protein [Streptomyces sp. TS71-3]|uniref:Gfo/Idh/MocA family protein n=1 Tax=Streptomyces sp. TS71-3 TaxID=2733862 RepID=UPI001B210184|nr:Gfo/Idh/MocA family oxidoreductase [Streptomyces sp. TS71-3]GHJ35954.1 oxidoreductase [Streptomyces sp. TS71-3]